MVRDLAEWFRRRVDEPDSGANSYDYVFLELAQLVSENEEAFAAVQLLATFLTPYLRHVLEGEMLSEQQIEYLKNVQLEGKPS